MQWSRGRQKGLSGPLLLSFAFCNSQELSWTLPLGAERTPSGFQRSRCASTRMDTCVTLMLLYLTLLDTASSIYPRIRLTHKGKKKKKKNLKTKEEMYSLRLLLPLTNKPGCDSHSFAATMSLLTVLDWSVFMPQSEVCWLSSTKFVPHRSHSRCQSRAQSVTGDRRLYHLTMATHTACCFSWWRLFSNLQLSSTIHRKPNGHTFQTF